MLGILLVASFCGSRLDTHGHPLPPAALARYGDRAARVPSLAVIGFSPDNKTLLRRGLNGTMLADIATGRDVTPAYMDDLEHPSVHLLHDGRHLLHQSRGCRILDPVTGETKHTFAPGFDVQHVELTPDAKGGLLIDAGQKKVAVVDFTASPPGVCVVEHEANCAALAPDRKRLYRWGKNVLFAADPKTGKVLAELKMPAETWPAAIRVTSQGDKLLVPAKNGMTVVPLTADGFGKPSELPGWTYLYRDIEVPEDGDRLLKGGEWVDLKTGREKLIPADHQKWPKWNHGRNYPSADGTLMATDLSPNIDTVVVWEVATGKTVRRFDEVPRPTAVVPTDGGATVTVADESRVVRRYDAATGRRLDEWATRRTDTAIHYQWAVPFDGGLLEVERFAATIVVSDPKTGKVKASLDHGVPVQKLVPKEAGGGEWKEVKIESADVRPELDRAVVVVDGRPVVFELSTGRRLRTLAHAGPAVALSPDGRLVAAANDRGVSLVEVSSGKVRRQMPTREFDDVERLWAAAKHDRPHHLRFTPDGTRLAAFGVCGGRVWTAEGERVAEFAGDGHGLGAISPDGKRVVVRVDERLSLIELDEPNQAKRVTPLRMPHGYMVSAEFMPDGTLLTAHADGLSYRWDVSRLVALHRSALLAPPATDWWAALADPDTLKAGAAVDALVRDPPTAVRVLGDRLRQAEPPDVDRVAALIDQLGDAAFATREKAEKELWPLADRIVPDLKTAAESDSAERAQRAGRVLAKLDGLETDPTRLRQRRAVEVLERVGTAEAKRVLKAVAGGPDSVLTTEAKEALRRREQRK